jgi:hypothetical protein
MNPTTLRARVGAYLQSDRGRRIGKWARRAFYLAILAVLARQMTMIGWSEIARSLPSQPLFYVIFAVMYFSLPATETLIYRISWTFRLVEGFLAFLKKRVYNKDVLGYSGEVYLYLWAEQRVGRPRREVVGVIKDNNIISSIASTIFGVSVLAVLIGAGQVTLPAGFLAWEGVEMVAAAMVVTVLVAIGVKFRRSIFWLGSGALASLFVIHLGRLIFVNVLQVLQWSVVLPDVGMNAWLTLIAVLIVTSRIPFLPARDLIFIGAGLELSQAMGIPVAGVAGMLLVGSVLDKTVNLALFSLVTVTQRRSSARILGAERPPALAVEDRVEASPPV